MKNLCCWYSSLNNLRNNLHFHLHYSPLVLSPSSGYKCRKGHRKLWTSCYLSLPFLPYIYSYVTNTLNGKDQHTTITMYCILSLKLTLNLHQAETRDQVALSNTPRVYSREFLNFTHKNKHHAINSHPSIRFCFRPQTDKEMCATKIIFMPPYRNKTLLSHFFVEIYTISHILQNFANITFGVK
jgi:hypothetical protein